jgi:hypothetical protein
VVLELEQNSAQFLFVEQQPQITLHALRVREGRDSSLSRPQ